MSTPINPLSNTESWNLVAENYGQMADWVMTPFAKKALEIIPTDKSASVIDVACGTGILTCMMANQVNDVHALDFSSELLSGLRARLTKREIQNVEIIHGDGQNLPFKDNTFDNAFSLFGLIFFPDRVEGFKELYRVLKPTGHAVVTSWAPIAKSTLMQSTSDAIKAVIADAPSPWAHSSILENPEIFKSEMEAAGFQSVTINEVTLELPEITPNMFWKLMSEGGAPIALLKKNYSPEEWNSINEKIIQHLNATYLGNSMKLSTTAYFGVGRKSN
jgi:ubiquinone/menaquinone biosynthesis C-methylase UbiE